MLLTRRQKEIRDYLAAHVEAHGSAPALEQIGPHFGLSSLATVHTHLSPLECKGLITRAWNLSRATELTSPGKSLEAVELPPLGDSGGGLAH